MGCRVHHGFWEPDALFVDLFAAGTFEGIDLQARVLVVG
jgi:hypothetical protein